MGMEVVNGLTGGETENPNVSNGLAGFACSPLPAREQIWLPDETRCQRQGSPVVSAAGKWVNRRRPREARCLETGRCPQLLPLMGFTLQAVTPDGCSCRYPGFGCRRRT